MKLINLTGNSSFSLDVPLTYRRSTFLKLALDAFAEGRVKRVSGRLGDASGSCACIVGLFTDNAYAIKNAKGCGVEDCYSFPASAFPDEVRLLDRDFLNEAMSFNDTEGNWFKSGTLTNAGKTELARISKKFGFEGISQVTGLAQYSA